MGTSATPKKRYALSVLLVLLVLLGPSRGMGASGSAQVLRIAAGRDSPGAEGLIGGAVAGWNFDPRPAPGSRWTSFLAVAAKVSTIPTMAMFCGVQNIPLLARHGAAEKSSTS